MAGELPELLADAMHEAFTLAEGPQKRAMAGFAAGAWYLAATAIVDRLRQDVPDLGEVEIVPAKIGRLRAIFRD